MTRISLLRITHRPLPIALVAIVLCGSAVLAWRRSLATLADGSELPEAWSGGPTFTCGSHGGMVYINTDDALKGINPPRLKWVPLSDAQFREVIKPHEKITLEHSRFPSNPNSRPSSTSKEK
jgi:hypothetical protein